MTRFPNVIFKAFCFNKKVQEPLLCSVFDNFDMLKYVEVSSIYELATLIQIYLMAKYNILQEIYTIFEQNNNYIFVRRYDASIAGTKLIEVDYSKEKQLVSQNWQSFASSKQIVDGADYINFVHKMLLDNTNIDYRNIDLNIYQYEYRFFITIKCALESIVYIKNNNQFVRHILYYSKLSLDIF